MGVKYNLDETNRSRLRTILAKAMTIGTILYTEDEKKRVDQKTLTSIIRQAALIRSIAWDIAHSLGIEVLCDTESKEEQMTAREVKELQEGYEKAAREAAKAQQTSDRLRSELRNALETLFKTDPKYYCPKCGKPMLMDGYRNARFDWMYCMKCPKCGQFEAATFDRMKTYVEWFNQCNKDE